MNEPAANSSRDLALDRAIAALTAKGEQFASLVYVGKDYSKADLLADLREAAAEEAALRARLNTLIEEVSTLYGMEREGAMHLAYVSDDALDACNIQHRGQP